MGVITGFGAAAVSAICYGVASVMQASAARAEQDVGGVDARLLTRLIKRGAFAASLGLDLIAFAAQFVALRYLAVYVVQAVQAGNLAVTAIAAIPILGARLAGREWAAIVAVCAGLLMLALAAGSERVAPVASAVNWSFLIAALAVTGLGWVVGRARLSWAPTLLGVAAGLGFGVVGLSARVITDLSFWSLLRNPATYALGVSGFVAFLLYTTALQRSAVTTVTAAVVIGETLLPAVIGVIFLGDRTRPGFVPVAVAGFVVAVSGALMLARFGEPVIVEPVPAV